MPGTLYTAGYQGRHVKDFVEELGMRGIDVLIDVRMNPISRKPGFSKTKLREALEGGGIRYMHVRELGNPSENRRQARSVAECLGLYEEHMRENWDSALEAVVAELENADVCLLCFEAAAPECHRSSVAREVHARIPAVDVVNI